MKLKNQLINIVMVILSVVIEDIVVSTLGSKCTPEEKNHEGGQHGQTRK